MCKRLIFFIGLSLFLFDAKAQKVKPVVDSLSYYDDLFSELDAFLDSITAPRNMLLLNVGVSNGFFNMESKNGDSLIAQQKINLSPSIGYYHKSGFGLNASATIIKNEKQTFDPYQFLVTGSYDYLHSNAAVSGISFTRFFTKDSLPFYTSPLENEANFYLVLKRWFIKPSLSVTYGWGNRVEYREREEFINRIRFRPRGYTQVTTEENVSDLSVTASLRHDYYWLNGLGANNAIRFTPQLSFNSGTQRFGFNQNSSTYALKKGNGMNVLYNSENVQLNEEGKFEPLSITAFLKSSFSFGSFSLQPQVSFDYYFPAKGNNFTTGFMLNAAVAFD